MNMNYGRPNKYIFIEFKYDFTVPGRGVISFFTRLGNFIINIKLSLFTIFIAN
jgi:hypothetical protein